MITPGTTYRFALRARNMYGYSIELSSSTSILAIDVPDKPSPPIITLGTGADTTKIRIGWSDPLTHGSPIEEYEVQIRTSTGTYVSNSGCSPIPLSA